VFFLLEVATRRIEIAGITLDGVLIYNRLLMSGFAPTARPEPPDGLSIESRAAFVAATSDFGFDLWRQIRTEGENQMISPASLSVALAMIWAGARGETATEMARTLRFEGKSRVHDAAAELLRDWSNPTREAYELHAANRLFGERSYVFKEAYLTFVRRHYGAPVEPMDFRNAPEPSRARINAWVESQTRERIRNLLPQGSVSDETGLVLANALYFRGRWSSPFVKEETRPGKFHTEGGGTVLVPMMRQKGGFSYGEADGMKLLEMHYAPGRLAMTIVLPSSVRGLGKLEEKITAGEFARWTETLEGREVKVEFPRFGIDPAMPLRLGRVMAEMGMPLAFGLEADLTGIAEPEDPRERLLIDDVCHKTFIKVDELGTEAAAATAVYMRVGKSMAPPPRPKRFVADRPFLFVIHDTSGGRILFVGRVANPSPDARA